MVNKLLLMPLNCVKLGVVFLWLWATGCGVKGNPTPYVTAEMLAAEAAAEKKASEAALATPTPSPSPTPLPSPTPKAKGKRR